MEKLTRNQAAKTLGVSPQTITNWCNKGILRGWKDETNGIFYVSKEDVNTYGDKYKSISIKEDVVDLYEESLCSKIELLEGLGTTERLNAKYIIDVVDSVLPERKDNKNSVILKEALSGISAKDISKKYNIDTNKIWSIVNYEVRTLNKKLMIASDKYARLNEIADMFDELKKENKRQFDEITALTQRIEDCTFRNDMFKTFSGRELIILKDAFERLKITNYKGLSAIKQSELQRFRGMGPTVINKLKELLSLRGLSLMDENIMAEGNTCTKNKFYPRRTNKNLYLSDSEMQDIFRKTKVCCGDIITRKDGKRFVVVGHLVNSLKKSKFTHVLFMCNGLDGNQATNVVASINIPQIDVLKVNGEMYNC